MSFCYDVAIVGGGVTGLATALAFAKLSSLRVLVLESHSTESVWHLNQTAQRVSAISPASQRIFASLGCWDWMEAQGVSPYRAMTVWSATGAGAVSFDAAELSLPTLGFIVDNALMAAGLTRALQATPTVDIQYAAQLSELSFHSDCASIQDASGACYRARLVVGADGAHSVLRTLAGFTQTLRSYDQTALVAQVETALPHNETAYQRFLPTGPLAFLPLASPNACSIVWSADPVTVARLQTLSEPDFCLELSVAFEQRLGSVLQVVGRSTFPLIKRHADRYVRDRCALIGDAAHTLHPLAGLGMNLGLLDALMLAETVSEAANKGRAFAGYPTLRRYERARRAANSAMLIAMDFFKQMSTHPSENVQRLWNAGMRSVNDLPWIKKYLMEYAIGSRGDLPKRASYASENALIAVDEM